MSNDWLGREALEDLLIDTFGMPDDTVRLALDGYAHELAEKQRAFFKKLDIIPPMVVVEMIDLIDPEQP